VKDGADLLNSSLWASAGDSAFFAPMTTALPVDLLYLGDIKGKNYQNY
jgi:hypothetical protein